MSLRIHGLSHRYGSQVSLHGVSLHVRVGDCFGFLGHNGAGKTTTLRIALGLMLPRTGRIIVDGFDARQYPREARARMGGLIEVPGFYLDATGRRNLIELGRLQGLDRRAAATEAGRVMELVGLAAAADRRVGGYSHGMRQRLGLGQALLGAPDYLLLDEPTNGLDPEGIAELRQVLIRLTRDEQVTLVLSSHQLHELTGLCNRVAVLKQGRLVLEAETETLLANRDRRYAIETDDADCAAAVYDRLGLEVVDAERRLVHLGAASPADVSRTLAASGVGLIRFQPEPATLEQIYLEATRAGVVTPEVDQPPPATTPTARRAPSRPGLRMLGFDARRLRRRWSVWAALAIAPAIAWWRVSAYRSDKDEHLAQVESGQLIETMNGTGFDAFGLALRDAVPVLPVVAVVLASQAIAGEYGRGTLRNVVLRPLRRTQVLLGKFAAVLGCVLVGYFVTVAVAMWRSAVAFGFVDVAEHWQGEAPEVVVDRADLWPLMARLVGAMILPLAAFAAIGLLVSTMVRRGVRALVIALSALAVLHLARGVAWSGRWEWLLPSAHLPLPPGDRSSYVVHFLEKCFGNDAAVFAYPISVYGVPFAWAATALLLSALIFARRRIP